MVSKYTGVMSTAIAPNRNKAFNDSIGFEIEDVVRELRDLLGAKLVAYIGNVKETRATREWAEGARHPNAKTERTLRLAHRLAKQIAASEGEAVVPAWFQGLNPHLGDRSPARLLRDGDFEQESPAVIAAADAFTGA